MEKNKIRNNVYIYSFALLLMGTFFLISGVLLNFKTDISLVLCVYGICIFGVLITIWDERKYESFGVYLSEQGIEEVLPNKRTFIKWDDLIIKKTRLLPPLFYYLTFSSINDPSTNFKKEYSIANKRSHHVLLKRFLPLNHSARIMFKR